MNVRLARGLLRTGGIALVLVSLVAAVHPHMGLLGYRRWLVIPVALVAVVVALSLRLRLPAGWGGRWVLPTMALASATVCTVAAQLMRYNYGWDANALVRMARTVGEGLALPQYAYDYLSLYPNTIPMIGLDRAAIGIGSRLGLAPEAIAVTGNGIALAVTLGVVGFLVRRVAGIGAALAAQLAVVVLVGLSPWMSVPYTDLPAMPFVVGAVALAVVAVEQRSPRARVLLWAASAPAVALAYVIKTTPAVVLVAVVLLVLVVTLQPGGTADVRRRRLVRGVVGSTVALATFAAGVMGFTATATEMSGIDTAHVRADVTPPVIWWLANGMNSQANRSGGTSYGSYSGAMVNAITGRTPAEVSAYARDFITERWDERGLPGTVSFYASKAVWNWGTECSGPGARAVTSSGQVR